MNTTIRVKIVTPNSILFNEEALMVTLPGTGGEFGVLPNHTLLIASLTEGIVKISLINSTLNISEINEPLTGKITNNLDNLPDSKKLLKFFISPGIAEITNREINIVTDFARDVTSIPLNELPPSIDLLRNMRIEN